MAKVGRPKTKKTYTVDELMDEDGNLIPQTPNSKYQSALDFKRAVEGESLQYNSNKGMYASMSNPQSYIQFYKHTIDNPRKGRPWTFPTAEALQKEVSAYFDFCIHRRIPVCVAGLGAWLGVSVATLRNWKQNRDTMPFYEVVEPAIAFIHSMVEQGAIDGNIPAIVYIFSSKNYNGLKDVQEYNIEPRQQLSIAEQDSVINDLPDEL